MKEKISNISAILGAFLASLCCIGPILFAALGIGGAGFAVGFEAYRLYFIVFAAAALGLAYYFTYRKREVKCEDGTCKVQSGSKKRKLMLWSITALAAFFIAFPYVNWSGAEEFDISTISPELNTVTILVEGMTCESCNKAVEIAVGKLDGVKKVKADYEKGEVKVAFNKKLTDITKIANTINDLGYKAGITEKIYDGGK